MKVDAGMKERTLTGRPRWRLSVIIPTLNEAAYLPNLLDALVAQTHLADEIIVADAGSTDGTVQLARGRGARVVHGGMPAVGRNAGAKVAQGEILFFLDADVVPPPDFLERATAEFLHNGYDVATTLMTPWNGNMLDHIVHEAANLYFLIMQSIRPYAPGFCILSWSSLHKEIGGFDETLRMSEDQDYVRRAARRGRFGVLTSVHIPVSMRRIRKEGLIGLGVKYLWCEANIWMGRPVRQIPFAYEFGAFPSPRQSGRQPGSFVSLSVGSLRQVETFQRLLRNSLHRWLPFSPHLLLLLASASPKHHFPDKG